MSLFTLIFICAIAINVGINWWLDGRQLRHIQAHREQVPSAFKDKIPLEDHQKAADYNIAGTHLDRLALIVSSLLLLAWTLGGGLEWVDSLIRSFQLPLILTGVIFLLGVSILMSLLELPLGLYKTFVLEERFGFNRTTWKVYVSDMAKQTLLMLLIGTPFLYVVLWLMNASGDLWWLYVWLVWTGFSLLMMWAYPKFIAPFFNKFVPLDQEALKQRIESLLNRCGFASEGVFVMDGSKRSAHGNAYFTGLGKNKRIVFFDTLLKDLSDEEIEAVLAHELGHFKHGHVKKLMAVTFLLSLVGLAILGWLAEQNWFYTELGMTQASDYAALMLFMLAAPLFTIFLQPIMAAVSRRFEFEADDFAATHANANLLIDALVKLYKENANTLTPDSLYSSFHDSHPPAPVRIAHLSSKLQHATV